MDMAAISLIADLQQPSSTITIHLSLPLTGPNTITMHYVCMYGLEKIKLRSKEEAIGLRGSCLGEEQVCKKKRCL